MNPFRTTLVMLLAVVCASPMARANMGPPWVEGYPVGEPLGALAAISIIEEDLVFDLLPLDETGREYEVSATYRLANHGPEAQVELLFVSPGVTSAKVALDDVPLEFTREENVPAPPEWAAPERSPALAGENEDGWEIFYHGLRGEQREFYYALRFNATIPSGNHVLNVRYLADAGSHHVGEPYHMYQVGYVLSPAKSWRSFGKLNLAVKVPPGWVFSSSLPLEETEGGFAATFDGLPADNLAFSLQPPVDQSALTWAAAVPILALVIGLFLALLAGRAVARRVHRKKSRHAAVVAITLTVMVLSAIVTGFSVSLADMFGTELFETHHLSSNYRYGRSMGTWLLVVPGGVMLSLLLVPLSVGIFVRRYRRRSVATGGESS